MYVCVVCVHACMRVIVRVCVCVASHLLTAGPFACVPCLSITRWVPIVVSVGASPLEVNQVVGLNG